MLYQNYEVSWNSLGIQWLGLHASTAVGMGLIPGWGELISCKPYSTAKTKDKKQKDNYLNKIMKLLKMMNAVIG